MSIRKEVEKALRFFQIMLLSSLVLLVTWVYAELNVKEKAVIINPSGIHEDCLEVLPTQILDYSFEASKPVKFNIHYHLVEGTAYPVSIDKVSTRGGIFHPKKQQKYYCMEWKNPHSESVSLNYRFRVKDK